MKVFICLIILSFSVGSYAQNKYTTFERLVMLFSGDNKKLKEYKTELYQSKQAQARRLMTATYKSWLSFKKTKDLKSLDRTLHFADQFNFSLRYMVSNQKYGDKEALVTLATTYRYEFLQEFRPFINSPWARENLSLFELGNLHTIVYDFDRVYFYDLEQPRH